MPLTPASFDASINSRLVISSGDSKSSLQGLPPLAVGEVVPATVVESRGGGRTVLLIKGSLVTAQSDLTFKPGERKPLMVEKLAPQVLLRVLSEGDRPSFVFMNDALKYFRIKPRSLFNVFTEAYQFYGGKNYAALAGLLGETDTKMLAALISSLVYSKETIGKGLFFQDYFEKLGFLLEHELANGGKKRFGGARTVQNASKNLKMFLMRIQEKLRTAQLVKSSFPTEKIVRFVDDAIRAVESHQVINSMLQEYEKSYFFQIPMQCADQMRCAEIFIRVHDKEGEKKPNEEKRTEIRLFLEMDSLGLLGITAYVKAKHIDCRITCASEDAGCFMSPFLGELERRLNEIGYGVGNLTCGIGDVREQYSEFNEEIMKFLPIEAVNVMA